MGILKSAPPPRHPGTLVQGRVSFLLLCSILSACAPGTNSGTAEQSVLGSDDRVVVARDLSNLPRALQAHAGSVGRILSYSSRTYLALKEGRSNVTLRYQNCSVAHIGQGLIITAGHCFNIAPMSEPKRNVECGDKILGVEWGHLPPLVDNYRPANLSRCEKIVFMDNQLSRGIDVAILKVANPPSRALAISESNMSQGESLSSMGYPGDFQSQLTYSGPCRAIGNRRSGASPDAIEMAGINCDSSVGQSGSSIFAMRGGTLKIVGILKGGGAEHSLSTPVSRFASEIASAMQGGQSESTRSLAFHCALDCTRAYQDSATRRSCYQFKERSCAR